MVPRFCSNSVAFMPMPLSEMVSVEEPGLALIWILSSLSDASSACVTASKRRLSSASEAFETSSRRNTSLWLYRELTTKCRTWLTSALKEWVVASLMVLPGATAPKWSLRLACQVVGSGHEQTQRHHRQQAARPRRFADRAMVF